MKLADARTTEAWYKNVGWRLINSRLTEIAGAKVGTLPLSNLECIPAGSSVLTLADLLRRDGLTVAVESGDIILQGIY